MLIIVGLQPSKYIYIYLQVFYITVFTSSSIKNFVCTFKGQHFGRQGFLYYSYHAFGARKLCLHAWGWYFERLLKRCLLRRVNWTATFYNGHNLEFWAKIGLGCANAQEKKGRKGKVHKWVVSCVYGEVVIWCPTYTILPILVHVGRLVVDSRWFGKYNFRLKQHVVSITPHHHHHHHLGLLSTYKIDRRTFHVATNNKINKRIKMRM